MLFYFGALPKDVHTELIQHKRAWMIKRRMVRGKLSVNSMELRLNGTCPLMPEEVRNYLGQWISYASGLVLYCTQKNECLCCAQVVIYFDAFFLSPI